MKHLVAIGSALALTAVAPLAFGQSVQAYKYDALGRVIVASSSNGGVDGYIYDAAGNRTYANKFTQHLPTTADRLVGNDGLPLQGYLISASGGYQLILQADGHLQTYNNSTAAIVFDGTSKDYDTVSVKMQTDGNLVRIKRDGSTAAISNTSGNTGAYAMMQDSGVFVVKNSAGTVIWTLN